MSNIKAKMHQIRFLLGLSPDPTGGAYSAPPGPLAAFRGPTSKEGGEGRGRPPRFCWKWRHCFMFSQNKVKCASPCQMWGGGWSPTHCGWGEVRRPWASKTVLQWTFVTNYHLTNDSNLCDCCKHFVHLYSYLPLCLWRIWKLIY